MRLENKKSRVACCIANTGLHALYSSRHENTLAEGPQLHTAESYVPPSLFSAPQWPAKPLVLFFCDLVGVG